MRWSPSLVVVLVCGLASGAEPKDPKTLDVQAETTAKAKALIAKLDDDDIRVRDRAIVDLKAMGRDALPALAGVRNGKPTPWLLARVQELLPAARRADFDARYPLFLADKDRKFDHALLGWNELKAAAKDTKESRLLFADILGDEECREMLLLSLDDTDAGRTGFRNRWEGKMNEWHVRSKAEFRAGIASNGPWPKPDDPLQWMPTAILADLLHEADYQTGYRHAVVRAYFDSTDEAKLAREGKGRYGPVVTEVILYWVGQQKGRYGLRDATAVVTYIKADKKLVLGMEEKLFDLMVSTGQGNGSLGHLAATKDPKYIASFRRLFDTDKPFWTPQDGGKIPEIQLRDAALSMCVVLSGQESSDYGFTTQSKNIDALRYDPYSYWFEAGDGKTVDDKRAAAFKKWGEWEKANPEAIKAKPPVKEK